MDYYIKKGHRYVPAFGPLITADQAFGSDGLIAMAAVRYCIGRMTYMPSVCADWLVSVWPVLSDRARRSIREDVEEAFGKDDRDRELGGNYRALGWDCDRQQWERVRKLWATREVGGDG